MQLVHYTLYLRNNWHIVTLKKQCYSMIRNQIIPSRNTLQYYCYRYSMLFKLQVDVDIVGTCLKYSWRLLKKQLVHTHQIAQSFCHVAYINTDTHSELVNHTAFVEFSTNGPQVNWKKKKINKRWEYINFFVCMRRTKSIWNSFFYASPYTVQVLDPCVENVSNTKQFSKTVKPKRDSRI